VQLLHPPHDGLRSGGHVYNTELIEAAALREVPLSSRLVRRQEVGARLRDTVVPFRLWDSLFLDNLAAGALSGTSAWGILLHYLPSENPTLPGAERARLAQIEARVIEHAERTIVTGQHLQSRIEQMQRRGPVFVCEPGISAAFLAPRDDLERRDSGMVEIVTVANLLPGKGLLEVLAALATLDDVPWRWHVIGSRTCDAVYTRRFEQEAQRLGLDRRIAHHGGLDHASVVRAMDRADLFVSGSRYEAYGMALAEAAARGLPAVATDVGATRKLYRHGRTGFITSPEDSERFRAHLGELMTNGALRRRFRDNLRAHEPRTWFDALDDFTFAMSADR
jgi:glycosyltransferase involved in cell wall biosynthesis